MEYMIAESVVLYEALIGFPKMNKHLKRQAIDLYISLLLLLLSTPLSKTVQLACYLHFKNKFESYPRQHLPSNEIEVWLQEKGATKLIEQGRQQLLAFEVQLYRHFFDGKFIVLPPQAYALIQDFIARMLALSPKELQHQASLQAYAERITLRLDGFTTLSKATLAELEVETTDTSLSSEPSDAGFSEPVQALVLEESVIIQEAPANQPLKEAECLSLVEVTHYTDSTLPLSDDPNSEPAITQPASLPTQTLESLTGPSVPAICWEQAPVDAELSYKLLTKRQPWINLPIERCWVNFWSAVDEMKVDCYAETGYETQTFTAQHYARDADALIRYQLLLGDSAIQQLFHCINIAPSLVAEQALRSAESLHQFSPTSQARLHLSVRPVLVPNLTASDVTLRITYLVELPNASLPSDSELSLHFAWKSEAVTLIAISLPSIEQDKLPEFTVMQGEWTNNLQPTPWRLTSVGLNTLQNTYMLERGIHHLWSPFGWRLFGLQSHAYDVFAAETPRAVRSLLWRSYAQQGASYRVLNPYIENCEPLQHPYYSSSR